MSLLQKLPQIIEKGREEYEVLLIEQEREPLKLIEKVGNSRGNLLVKSDNLLFMRELLQKNGMKGKINLVYIDPPFFSKVDYGTDIRINSEIVKKIPIIRQHAYRDTWENGMEEYLIMLTARFYMIKELLSSTGSFFIHLDWHVVHYVKIILDEIFGEKNFVNEIIWQYKSGGVSKRYFARKHDTLLFYAKTSGYYFSPQLEKSYNRAYKPYRFKGVKEYRDELGWYTMVNMKDVWPIDMVGRTSAERTGYATQKPEALLERILESCTKEGDLVADFFGGSGTLAAAADRMKRSWISCDIGKSASVKANRRLAAQGAVFDFYEEKASAEENETDAKILLSLLPKDLTGNRTLSVELSSYSYKRLKDVPVDEKYIPVIKKILDKDPLQLVDYWSIDFHYDGKTFKPASFFCRENGKLDQKIQIEAEGFSRIALRIVDVFGNSTFKDISL